VPLVNHDRLLLALGTEVRQRRITLQLSQEELADRCGLHRTYVGSVERGERNVSLVNIAKLASALETSIGELVSRAEQHLFRMP
jgi:transcriptional regulator with XRE-family HTH domain